MSTEKTLLEVSTFFPQPPALCRSVKKSLSLRPTRSLKRSRIAGPNLQNVIIVKKEKGSFESHQKTSKP